MPNQYQAANDAPDRQLPWRKNDPRVGDALGREPEKIVVMG